MANTKEVLTFAVEMGDNLLRNGAEVYRVEDTVLNILKAYNITECDVYVLSNGIFASADENTDNACSVVRHVPLMPTHLGRVAKLNTLSRDVCDHKIDLKEAEARLNEIKKIPYASKLNRIICCGIGSGCFSFLFGGTVLDGVVAFFIGMVLQIALIALGKAGNSKFVTTLLGSSIVTILALLAHATTLPVLYDKIIIGDIMNMVPGIAITTSIRDFVNGDYLSGAIHLIDALLTAFCIAVGVGVIITFASMFMGGIML